MENPEKFKNQSYIEVQDCIDQELCKIVTDYCLLKEKTELEIEHKGGQVENAHSVYGDTLMDTLMSTVIHKIMEEKTGLELCPTYTYYRVYRKGMDLKRHTDRESCEISSTVCFGFNYKNMPEDYSWGIFVDPISAKIPKLSQPAKDGTYNSHNNPGIEYKQNPGDMLIYKGMELEHWREKFDVPRGSWQVQAFFHYIDKNGPNYPTWKWDQRKSLGIKK
jgi:hypothetical protein